MDDCKTARDILFLLHAIAWTDNTFVPIMQIKSQPLDEMWATRHST